MSSEKCRISRGTTVRNFSLHDRAVVRRAVSSLPEAEALVVLLRYWGSYDCAEIAHTLGLHASAVRKTLGIAHRNLRSVCSKDPDFGLPHPRADAQAA